MTSPTRPADPADTPAAVRPIVLIADELSPATVDALGPDFDIRYCDGTDRAALLAAIPLAQALLVRSTTQVDAEVLAAGRALRVIARAGVGLDNIDVDVATKLGIMVVNAPLSNIVSAAEHAVGLLLATARNIPQANASLHAGEWRRSQFTGAELADKTVGILGLGRIGTLVATRLAAFDMRVIAYDPYVQPSRAAYTGVRMVSLDELLAESDFITVHIPRTPETRGLLGADAFYKVKPTVRIVNAARGGIVDEEALAEAIRDGRVAGAGIDVFATEPCTDSPLFALPSVVVTPHLGASTEEAQEKAGVSVARSVRLALAGGLVPDAVNVQGGAIDEEVRPNIALAETLGRVFTALAGQVAARLDIEVRGELVAHDVKVLQLAALRGAFTDVVEDPVTFVNAPLFASERGVDVRLTTSPDSPDYRSVVTVRGTLPDGSVHSVSGTLAGHEHINKLVEIDGFDIDIAPTSHMAIFRYVDRPGVIGIVGKMLGDAGINIGGMQVGRDVKGGQALVVLSVDTAIPAETLDAMLEAIGADGGRTVDLQPPE